MQHNGIDLVELAKNDLEETLLLLVEAKTQEALNPLFRLFSEMTKKKFANEHIRCRARNLLVSLVEKAAADIASRQRKRFQDEYIRPNESE